ncbi:MAG: hypothetical protein CO135_01120 [Candidatus Levybacteria bacterium CG_4_9_14_3_um_filter_35_16]|nr:MAG: hypothetical protein COW87_03055 [Candidatus Levybacteria bacterium CG22_combo_CG10-13_8_21_14_all_35_11]PIY93881.1 MAG: hypothetical protein COY68_04970 [Candidatus Levybacteria bacterium CG_4_10_14_0_8_um_filter_35_23]PIZ99594.1 MAG: hypothetical protein COX78_01685 [Candidatus Levybacteria bacterium CG_4_10_14_0_2_um_filter_35_8]PJA91467.1 MAG: hypothetical protein CO135_01120 [Candidatus Levybacteria bacterium CG_4_9_14_3_um_filter_35_16]PJC54686.1 MAG: hypothetical protein CO028_00
MEIKKFKFKRDKYRKTRGGTSHFLDLYCTKCKNHLLLYQKDGPGILKRLYLDRILAPDELISSKLLVCLKCSSLIGNLSIYEKEKRKAFNLIPGTLTKKISKGEYDV